jgi:hypothetical protein
VVRLFGRLRELRKLISALSSSIVPMINAFLILFIVLSICKNTFIVFLCTYIYVFVLFPKNLYGQLIHPHPSLPFSHCLSFYLITSRNRSIILWQSKYLNISLFLPLFNCSVCPRKASIYIYPKRKKKIVLLSFIHPGIRTLS